MTLPRVLIVDDDAVVRRMYATALRTTCEVVEVSDGRAALGLLANEPFALMVLDLHMPGLDGFDVLKAMAGKPGPNADIPVIVVTADGTPEAQARALKTRSAYFLSKPVPIRVLLQTVQSMLERANARRSVPR